MGHSHSNSNGMCCRVKLPLPSLLCFCVVKSICNDIGGMGHTAWPSRQAVNSSLQNGLCQVKSQGSSGNGWKGSSCSKERAPPSQHALALRAQLPAAALAQCTAAAARHLPAPAAVAAAAAAAAAGCWCCRGIPSSASSCARENVRHVHRHAFNGLLGPFLHLRSHGQASRHLKQAGMDHIR